MIGSWPEILLASGTAAVGVVCLAGGLQGWLRTRATVPDRALLLVAGALLVVPWLAADVAGLALMATTYVLQTLRRAPGVASAIAPSLD
jgi:TRAP-type uncharacterized transport system fused permease subunit